MKVSDKANKPSPGDLDKGPLRLPKGHNLSLEVIKKVNEILELNGSKQCFLHLIQGFNDPKRDFGKTFQVFESKYDKADGEDYRNEPEAKILNGAPYKLTLSKAGLENPIKAEALVNSVLLEALGKVKTKSGVIRGSGDIKDHCYFKNLEKKVPVLNGIMEAFDSSSIFLQFIDEKLKDKLKNAHVLQFGSNQGAITSMLARYAKEVVAVDIQDKAIKNTKLTLSTEAPAVQQKVKALGLSNLDQELPKLLGEANPKFDFVFFNNPVIKIAGDPNNAAGKDFGLIHKTIKEVLPRVLKPGGKAYMLAAINWDPPACKSDNLFCPDKYKKLMQEPCMKGWSLERLGYCTDDNPWHQNPQRMYSLVEIQAPHNHSLSDQGYSANNFLASNNP